MGDAIMAFGMRSRRTKRISSCLRGGSDLLEARRCVTHAELEAEAGRPFISAQCRRVSHTGTLRCGIGLHMRFFDIRLAVRYSVNSRSRLNVQSKELRIPIIVGSRTAPLGQDKSRSSTRLHQGEGQKEP